MINFLKTYWSSISAIFVAASAIVGATIAVESRYASAKELTQLRTETYTVMEKMKQETRFSVDSLRKQQLEDKIFELNVKPVKTPTDEALIRRYNQQLKETTDRLNASQSSK